MVVLVGSSGTGAGMLVARVDSVCMQQGQSKQFAHLEKTQTSWKLFKHYRGMFGIVDTVSEKQSVEKC